MYKFSGINQLNSVEHINDLKPPPSEGVAGAATCLGTQKHGAMQRCKVLTKSRLQRLSGFEVWPKLGDLVENKTALGIGMYSYMMVYIYIYRII